MVQKQLIDLGLGLEKLSIHEQPSPKDVSWPKNVPSPKDEPSLKNPKDIPAETPNPVVRPDTSMQEESLSPTSEASNPFQQKDDVSEASSTLQAGEEKMQRDDVEIIQVRAVDDQDNVIQLVNLQVAKGLSSFISLELFKFLPVESQKMLMQACSQPIPEDIVSLMGDQPMFETDQQLVAGSTIIPQEDAPTTSAAQLIIATTSGLEKKSCYPCYSDTF